jgi:hypothetical protein
MRGRREHRERRERSVRILLCRSHFDEVAKIDHRTFSLTLSSDK